MKTPIVSCLVAALALLPSALYAAPSTINITANADTFVLSSTPTLNYGGAGALQIAGSAATNSVPVSHGDVQTLLQFNTAAAISSFNTQFGPGQWNITAITLQTGTNFGGEGTQPNNPIFDKIHAGLFSIDWLASDAWLEGTGNPAAGTTDGITYNGLASLQSASDQTLGTFNWTANGNTGGAIPPATWSLAKPATFLSDLAAGGPVSFRLYAAETTVSYLINSRTFAGNQPTLILTADAVPEPASLALLATGTLLLFRTRRRP